MFWIGFLGGVAFGLLLAVALLAGWALHQLGHERLLDWLD